LEAIPGKPLPKGFKPNGNNYLIVEHDEVFHTKVFKKHLEYSGEVLVTFKKDINDPISIFFFFLSVFGSSVKPFLYNDNAFADV
jgi:hypothetical protein